jgi:hypothetical protein
MTTGGRWVTVAAWTGLSAAALGLALFALRAGYAISFVEPLQLVTSGAEHDALFAIWKQIHGLDIYTDRHRIPFASSNYNWLFFEGYGWIAGAVMKALALGDAWLPTVTRLITVGICVIGVALLFADLRSGARAESVAGRAALAAFAIWFFFGPLGGFWTIATNVELGATVFLIASLYAFNRLYPTRPWAAVLWFIGLAYAAWAMKQNYVYTAGAVGLFLLLRRDWSRLALLSVLLPAAWALTLWLGSDAYLKMLFFQGTDMLFQPGTALRNISNAGGKTLAVWLGLAGALVIIVRRPAMLGPLWREQAVRLYALGLFVSLVMVVPMSAMHGAAENYYFPVVYFAAGLCFTVLFALDRLSAPVAAGWVGVVGGWLAGVAAVALVITGHAGVISTRNWHDQFTATKACIDRLPTPAFTAGGYNMLPWMYPAGPHFITAFKYPYDRARGVAFERDGLGGMIRDGYFAALLLDPNTERHDGAALAPRYERKGECAGKAVWLRRGAAAQ